MTRRGYVAITGVTAIVGWIGWGTVHLSQTGDLHATSRIEEFGDRMQEPGGRVARARSAGRPLQRAVDTQAAVFCVSASDCADDESCALSRMPPRCIRLASEGDSCEDDLDCADEMICNMAYAPAVCLALGREGDLCVVSDECDEELECNHGFDPSECSGPQGRGGPCGDIDDCNGVLACTPTPSGRNQCQLPSGTEALCLDDDGCLLGLWCNTGFTPARCKLPQPIEGPCEYDGHCLSPLACGGTEEERRCIAPFSVVSGSICISERSCAVGLRCVHRVLDDGEILISGVCSAPMTVGAPCAEDLDCETNLCGDGGVCREVALLGDPCVEAHDCGGGLRCNAGLSPPHCAFPQDAGGPCAAADDCWGDLICDTVEDPSVCAEPGFAEWGEPCAERLACAVGLTCNLDIFPGTCMPLGGEGVSCVDIADCQRGLMCAERDEHWLCLPAATEGEECVDDDDCHEGLICNYGSVPSICVPPQPIGGPCDWDGDCEGELECGGAEPVSCIVAASLGVGEECAFNDDCQESLVCNEAVNPARCLFPGSDGEPCSDPSECDGDLTCILGRCSPSGREDEPCTGHSDCVEHLACLFSLDPPRCKPPRDVGELCFSPGDCTTGRCDYGRAPPTCAL